MLDGLALFRVVRDLLLFLVLFRKLRPRLSRVRHERSLWVSAALLAAIAFSMLAHTVLFGRNGLLLPGPLQSFDRMLVLQLSSGVLVSWYFLALRPKAAFFAGVCYALSLRIAQMFYSEVVLSAANLGGVRQAFSDNALLETAVVTAVCTALMFMLAPDESEVDERAITSSQVVLLGFVVLVYLLMRYTNGQAADAGSVMLRALQCVSLFVFCLLAKRSIGHTHRLIEASEGNALLVAEYARLKERSDNGERTRVLYHDLRHIIELLKSDERAAYLAEPLEAVTSRVSSRHYTGNAMLNALVNDMAERCRAAGTRFDARLNLGDCEFVDDFDLCSLVANGFSNALEACAAYGGPAGPFVGFQAVEHPAAVVFQLENRCNPQEEEGGLAGRSAGDALPWRRRSGKADGAEHGIGLSSIAATVERYDGVVLREIVGDAHRLVITLPKPPAEG